MADNQVKQKLEEQMIDWESFSDMVEFERKWGIEVPVESFDDVLDDLYVRYGPNKVAADGKQQSKG